MSDGLSHDTSQPAPTQQRSLTIVILSAALLLAVGTILALVLSGGSSAPASAPLAAGSAPAKSASVAPATPSPGSIALPATEQSAIENPIGPAQSNTDAWGDAYNTYSCAAHLITVNLPIGHSSNIGGSKISLTQDGSADSNEQVSVTISIHLGSHIMMPAMIIHTAAGEADGNATGTQKDVPMSSEVSAGGTAKFTLSTQGYVPDSYDGDQITGVSFCMAVVG